MSFEKELQSLNSIIEGLDSPDVSAYVDAMLSFYRDHRVDGVDLDGDGDMLLFQWGTYDWGEGENFELDMTRQFTDEEEFEMTQLHMTLKFKVSDELKQLEDGNEWCHSPEKLNDFVSFIDSSKTYQLLGMQHPSEIEIFLDEV